ncbi:aldo/keto reductase [Solibacillus silvestris StLB046]|uniref:Aldo/keto reductase n=1 Tax=Solibacillus silvestris (strain StLB046) TaxID=1002809 RepID=F2F3W9_SOLSS|nr:hypothetical protein [Solibacillus silvestris]BAK17767.1 aldo/keto reductase [Solibacillus silvestris StLB046]
MEYVKALFLTLLVVLFSFINFATTTEAESWEVKDEKIVKDPQKVWKITFSDDVNISTINNQNIYVNEYNNLKINNEVKVGETNNVVLIYPPENGYEVGGNYTLYITNIVSATEQPLAQSVKMNFSIEQGLMEYSPYFVANGVGISSKFIENEFFSDKKIRYLKREIKPDPMEFPGKLQHQFNGTYSNSFTFKVPEQQDSLKVTLNFDFLDEYEQVVAIDHSIINLQKTKVDKSAGLKRVSEDSNLKISASSYSNSKYINYTTRAMGVNDGSFFTTHLSEEDFTIDEALKETAILYYMGEKQEISKISKSAHARQIPLNDFVPKNNKIYAMIIVYDEDFNAIYYMEETFNFLTDFNEE